MKRLVISGLPCPAEAWQGFLNSQDSEQIESRVISMGEVFAHTDSHDPRDLANYTHDEIARVRPQSILCHGIGVPLALLSLWRLRKKEGADYQPRLTIFNGAFHNVSLLKARQPLWIQCLPAKSLIKTAELAGGRVDTRLVADIHKIRALYRAIILHRATEKIASLLGLEHMGRVPQGERFRLDVQVIASTNDPFLPVTTMKELAHDLRAREYVEMEYGHFPYSGSATTILGHVREFENRLLN